MPSTRHVNQTTGGACYKLIARLRNCAETVELNGFRSIPEAQAGLAGFVIETAKLGDISDLCLERRDVGSSSNAAAEITLIKRWNGEFADRILRQQNLHREPAPSDSVDMPSPYPTQADPESKEPELGIEGTPNSPTFDSEVHPAAPFVPPISAFDSRSEVSSISDSKDAIPPETPNGAVEPILLLAQAIHPQESSRKLAELYDSIDRTSRAEARPAKYSRPAGNHRRTRWELAIAIFLTAAVAFTILLWDSGGDPLSLFMPRSAASLPRDSLPFQVRPASSRNSASPSPTEP